MRAGEGIAAGPTAPVTIEETGWVVEGNTNAAWMLERETEGSARVGEGNPCAVSVGGFEVDGERISGGESGNNCGVENTSASSLETGVVGVVGATGNATLFLATGATARAFTLPPICKGPLDVAPTGFAVVGTTAGTTTGAAVLLVEGEAGAEEAVAGVAVVVAGGVEAFIEVRILARTFCIEVDVVGVFLGCCCCVGCCFTGEGVAAGLATAVAGVLETAAGAFFFAGC